MGEKLIHNYLKDILLHIAEIEQIQADAKDLEGFKKNFYFNRTSERNFLIIGEIVKKLATLNPELLMHLRNRENIIGLRNFFAHAYDTVDNEQMWLFIVKRAPELKEDINKLLKS
jgi:uncharacterized protein with HEPN domain